MTKAGKTIGSIFILAGTSLGAGMLALPIAIAKIGLLSGIFFMLLIWALMTLAAFMILEVTIKFGKPLTISKICNSVVGNSASITGDLSIIVLFYALLAAYISAGPGVCNQILEPLLSFEIPRYIITLIFTLTLAGMVQWCVKAVDYSNRFFFFIKLLAFTAMILILFSHFNTTNVSLNLAFSQNLATTIPLIFISFGFHGSITAVIKYVGIKNIVSLRKILLVSSLIPLVVYLLFVISVLGVLPQSDFAIILANGGDVEIFVERLSNKLVNSNISYVIQCFSCLAIITSFLGVSVGLLDFFNEKILKLSKQRNTKRAFFITFLPPAIIALLFPTIFIKALGFGAIALSILAVILPSLCAYKMVNQNQYQNPNCYISDSKTAILITLGFGCSIVITELYNLYLH